MLIFMAMLSCAKNFSFFLFIILGSFLKAQTYPSNKSLLNYTQVLLETPVVIGATEYEFQITDTKTNQLIIIHSNSNSVISKNLEFARTYSWKVKHRFPSGHKDSTESNLFFLKPTEQTNVNNFRFRPTQKYSEADSTLLILIDYNRVAINRTGNPVWYLPDIKGKVDATQRIRDLRMTKDGTFTFLTNKSAIECDINGNLVWEAPDPIATSNDTTGFYHHCFKKLSSGNYMVLGTKSILKEIPESAKNKISNIHEVKLINNKAYIKVEYGLIQEFDEAGKPVWQWDSEKYLDDKDIFNHGNADTIAFFGPHMNSFDIDETKDLISVSFRDLSRILLINKKTSEIINSFGKQLASEDVKNQVDFNYQHDCRLLKNGNIAIFNNNNIIENNNVVSSVMIIDPKLKTGNPVWNFNCNFDSLANGRSLKGGGVYELQNGNLLVSMGHQNRLFEVTKNKKIVWSGFYEKYSSKDKTWMPYPQYRISPVETLYPIAFGCSLIQSKKQNLKLYIKNLGTIHDTYNINIVDKNGNIISILKTKEIKAGQSGSLDLKLKSDLNQNLLLVVTSSINKKISKQISLNNPNK